MLTRKQKEFYDGLTELIRDLEYFPSVREIARELGFSSPATVHAYLDRLAKNGFLHKKNGGWTFRQAPDHVPLAGLVPAGDPLEIFEDLGESVQVPEWIRGNAEDILALRVRGDSMKDAYIQDGDIVVIQKSPRAHPREMVVAVLEDHSITLKRLHKEGRRVWLEPENPAYPPIHDPFRIAGRVIGVIRKYR
jgi:repressor LexA